MYYIFDLKYMQPKNSNCLLGVHSSIKYTIAMRQNSKTDSFKQS